MWRDEAWRGRAGQAFEVCEPGVMNGTTANSLAASDRGPRQDDQVAKTKFLARNCLRILDQSLGLTRARSRTNRPLEKKPGTMAGLAQGWAGHPFHSRLMQLTKAWNTRSGRSRAASGHALGSSGSGSGSLSGMWQI
jgi:hypothetical protein